MNFNPFPPFFPPLPLSRVFQRLQLLVSESQMFNLPPPILRLQRKRTWIGQMMKLLSASLPPIKARPKRTGMQKKIKNPREKPDAACCHGLGWARINLTDGLVTKMLVMPLFCFELCCRAVCIDLFFVSLLLVGGQSWAPDRTIWRPNPSSSHPMPAPKPLPHLFFPPTPIITPPHLDQKVTFLPFLEPTGYSVTIKVYHDAITVTLSRLMDNWSTIVHIIIIFSLTVRSLIRYSAHQRGFGIGLYWRED